MVEGITSPRDVRTDVRTTGEKLPDGPLVGAARVVEATGRQFKEKVSEAKDVVAQKTLGDLVEDGRGFVRRNPVTTLVVAAGVGALVGYVLARRRK